MKFLLWPFKATYWVIRKTMWVALFLIIGLGVGLYFGLPLHMVSKYATMLPVSDAHKESLKIASNQTLTLRYSYPDRSLLLEANMQPGSISEFAKLQLPIKAKPDRKCNESLGRLSGLDIISGNDSLVVTARAVVTGVCYENPFKLKGLKFYKGYSVKTPPGGDAKAKVSMVLKPNRNSQTQEILGFGIFGLDVDGSRFVEALNVDELAERAVRDAIKPMLYVDALKAKLDDKCDASDLQLYGSFGNGSEFDGYIQLGDITIGKCLYAVGKQSLTELAISVFSFGMAIYNAIDDNYF